MDNDDVSTKSVFWYCIVSYCIACSCMVLHNVVLYCIVLHLGLWYGIVLYDNVLYHKVLHCMCGICCIAFYHLFSIAWFCIILHCSHFMELHNIANHGIVGGVTLYHMSLHCIAWFAR